MGGGMWVVVPLPFCCQNHKHEPDHAPLPLAAISHCFAHCRTAEVQNCTHLPAALLCITSVIQQLSSTIMQQFSMCNWQAKLEKTSEFSLPEIKSNANKKGNAQKSGIQNT